MKRINKTYAIIIIAFVTTLLLQSCGALMSDPSFQEGYRQGWNSTAPSEYRY
ncbi:MAG: hypothetical protein IIU87_04160 [Prevotella sp.]|nr:hypothetical protein [Prevotella sp.]